MRMNMKEEITKLLQTQRALFFVNKFLEEFPNAELYLVGGAVRDMIMKRKMMDVDFDFVVRLLPEKELETWFSVLGEIDFVGRTFGVFKFTPEGMDPAREHPIDIALPRKEQPHAQSKGGYKEFDVQSDIHLAIEEDLSRRDFTMNALAIDLRSGNVMDPFGGEADIRARLIRAVGDPTQRFNEDLSRMLRAIRFAAELQFEIEEKTKQAIEGNVHRLQDEAVVPRETIGNELAKALTRNPVGALQWMEKTGAWNALFGKTLHASDQETIARLSNEPLTLLVALLLRHDPREQIPSLLSRCGLDALPRGTTLRIEPSDVLWLVDRLNETWNTESVLSLRASTFEKYFMSGRGELLIQALEGIGEGKVAQAARQRCAEIRERWNVEKGDPIVALLSGNDILNAGFSPGPNVRELLESLRDAQLDGRILTREQAKQWLRQQAAQQK